MRRRHSTFGLTVLGALLMIPASEPASSAQEPQQPAAVFFETIDVQVVNVQVFVNDRSGRPIAGLTVDDFVLIVDGDETPISNFYAEAAGRPVEGTIVRQATRQPERAPSLPTTTPADQRLRVVLFIDNANIRSSNRKQAFDHLRRFLDAGLRPDDSVSVVSLGDSLRIHSDFLNDRPTIDKILREIQSTSVKSGGARLTQRQLLNEFFSGTAMRSNANRTLNTDNVLSNSQLYQIRAYAQEEFARSKRVLATLESFAATLAGVPGRKALLYVSDGIANRPGEELFLGWRDRYRDLQNRFQDATLESDYNRQVGQFDLLVDFQRLSQRLNNAGVTFYMIDSESDHLLAMRSAAVGGGVSDEARSVLEANIRDPFESVSVATGGQRFQASGRLAEELGKIATDFDSYYSLGFMPDNDFLDKEHTIQVKLRNASGVVRHRGRFELKNPTDRMADATLATLLYNASENPMGLRLEPGAVQERDDGSSVLPVKVKIPLSEVTLLPNGDQSVGQLSLFISTKDAAGQPRPVQRIPFHLQIPADKVEEARGFAAEYDLPVVVRPGDQQVAVGGRDEFSGVYSTVRLELTSLPSD